MEVSTSYCSSFKYGSFKEGDELAMEERFGSYNSHNDSFNFEGSIGDEMEGLSSDGEGLESEASSSGTSYGGYDDMEMEMSGPEATGGCPEESVTTQSDQEENDDEWTNQKQGTVTRHSVAYYAAMEMLRIRFPFQSISIKISDFCCLQEKDLLNDTMIDFYLNHIVEHILPDHLGRKVTVLPAVFWHNLSLRQHALDGDEDEAAVNRSDDEKLDLKFKDLHDFVAEFDLQDVDFIVIPVNEWEHWTLTIVCHPFTDHSRTVIFDSQLTADLNNLQNMASLIDTFMAYSWKKRTGTKLPYPMKFIVPLGLPQQTNNFDCGVFIVEFARRFLLDPPKDLDKLDFTREYGDFCVAGKRYEMQKAVLSLCSNRQQWKPLVDVLNGINTAVPHRAL